MDKYKMIHDVLVIRYIEQNGGDISDRNSYDNLLPADWFAGSNYKLKSDILFEAISEKKLVFKTSLYGKLSEDGKSNADTAPTFDVEYAISKYMDKYGVGRTEALNQIKLLVEEKNYNRMTSYGDARNTLRQYSFSELALLYEQIINSD